MARHRGLAFTAALLWFSLVAAGEPGVFRPSTSLNNSAPLAQEGVTVERALELYVEGMIHGNADRIPLASDVIFVEPDGSTESTLRGISEVAPFLERQPIDDIQVHQTLVDGEYGCELTDYYWTDGPKMPIALCLRVVNGKITEIRPYFDRTLFGR